MTWYTVGAWVVGSLAVDTAVRNADTNRKMAHTNADIAKQRATIAAQQANVNEDAQRRRADLAIGTQRAAIAQAGVGFEGTGGDLVDQSSTNAEMDALNIRYGGKIGVVSDTEQANLSSASARSAMTAGYVGAAAGALSAYGGYRRSQPAPAYGGGGSGLSG